MKKMMGVIVFFTLLFTFSVVNADLMYEWLPDIQPYEAKVSNPNGAEYIIRETNETGILPYEMVVTVLAENKYPDDNTIYAYTTRRDENGIHDCEVKLSDLSLTTGETMASKDISHSTSCSIMVRTKGGLILRKGPSQIYEETDVIVPYGASVTCYDYAFDAEWVYVEYDGKTGWMYNERQNLFFVPQERKEFYLLETVNVSGITNDGETKMVRFEKGEIINDYLERDYRAGGIGVYKDDAFVLIAPEYLAINKQGTLVVEDSTMVIANNPAYFINYPYEEFIMAKEIPVGTTLSYDYIYPQYQLYHVTYQGGEGWISDEGVFHKGEGTPNDEKLEDFNKIKGQTVTPTPIQEEVVTVSPQKRLIEKIVIGVVFLAVVIFIIIKKEK